MAIKLREVTPADTENVGRIVFEAFRGIAQQHNFPLDFPSVEAGLGFAGAWVGNPHVYGVVAEDDGKFIGSNFLSEFDEIRGVGPITVDPAAQSRGTGRMLMEAVIERGRSGTGIRLVQDAFNTKSMSLYASLGFDVVEPLALMSGKPSGELPAGYAVRPMTADSAAEAAALCEKVYGISRANELQMMASMGGGFVTERDGRITAYMSSIAAWHMNHGVAETDEDMQNLLLGASQQAVAPIALLLPVRQANLHRWALRSGLRMVKPLTLMAMGKYREPQGSFFPSVMY